MIAIIGHGPSLRGSRLGEYIDSFKYVIRFPYLKNWQTPIDYGVKTSFVCSPNGGKIRRIRQERPELGYYLWDKHPGSMVSPMQCRMLGIEKYEDVSRLIQKWAKKLPKATPNLSTGTAGILIAAAKLGEPITAFGCDHLKLGKDMSKNYVGSWLYEGRMATWRNIQNKCTHSLSHDRELINVIEKKYNVTVDWKHT